MSTPLRLLILEDSPDDAAMLLRELQRGGFEPTSARVETRDDFLRQLENPPELVLSDYALRQFNGAEALELMRQRGLDIPFILVSGTAGEEQVVEAMKRGASDYLLKDRIARLGTAVAQALEQKRMRERLAAQQQALLAGEARLSGIINAATDAIITVDGDQRIVLFNPAAEQMFGYQVKDLLGQPLDRLIPQRFHQAHKHHVKSFGATGVTSRRMGALGTIFGLHADGTEFPIEASISQLEAGGQKLFTVILRDITARKLGEEARNRLAAIVESSDDAIISESTEGVIMTWNAGAERIFGYRAAEVIGQPITGLIPPELRSESAQRRAAVHRGERISQWETVRLRKDGTRIQVAVTLSPIRDPEGRVVGVARIARDITERKRLEAVVAEATEEERGRIARDLHHGLGQHLGGALFLSDLLQRDLKARQAVEGPRAGQVHQLIVESLQQVRELSRGLYPVPAEAEGLMTALQNLADRVSRDRKLACTFDANASVLLEDRTLATHLYRIAQEAVNNALKHSHSAQIDIHLVLTADQLELRVRDAGRGLPADTPSGGLGMQTMRHRAHLIGARLSVENAAEGGVRVTCTVPRTWSDKADPKLLSH